MREVAGLAGVAVGTVSHYLNHPDKVSAEKAERIRAAIETLGFVPNNAGRQLRLGTSRAVAYIAPDVSNPFFAEIAEDVERRASEQGLTVFIANSHRSREREDAYLALFEQHQVQGLLVASHEPIEDRLARSRQRGTPSVLVGQAGVSEEQPSVSLDDVSGGHQAAAHLLAIGCRRIAFVGGPLGIKQIGDRLTGASDAVREAGTATLEVVNATDRTLRGGRAAAQALLERPPELRPEGIFAANDLLALGMLQVFVDAGVRVPEELAMVGYDDIEFGEASLIPLSSVRGRHADFGSAALDLLVELIQNGVVEDPHRVYEPTLVVRRSSEGFVPRG
ncbi:LacI family transcriptional regulator [Homoserinibacter sp. GY 40078]|nr:LacI family transcriptional regulator [Homoserinibacter sp. GY 40078]